MSDMISLTLIDSEEIIKVSIINETPLTVSFYNISLPDPRVTQALLAAQAAQAATQAIYEQVVLIEQDIDGTIEEAVAEVAGSAIVNALIFG
jgi:hypothetical protein